VPKLARSVSGTEIPSALAVLRLDRLDFVDCQLVNAHQAGQKANGREEEQET